MVSSYSAAQGFSLDDLPLVEPILSLFLERSRQDLPTEALESLIAAICGFIRICGRPIDLPSSAAEVKCRQTVVALIACVSFHLFSSPHSAIKAACADALTEFVDVGQDQDLQSQDPRSRIEHGERKSVVESSREKRRWEMNQGVFAEAEGVKWTVLSVEKEVAHLFAHDDDGDGVIDEQEYMRAHNWIPGEMGSSPEVFMVAVMRLMRALSRHEENAFLLVKSYVLHPLVKVVSCLKDFRKQEVKIMLEVLWNVLQHSLDRLHPSKRTGSTLARTRFELMSKHRHGNALFVLGNTDTIALLKRFLKKMLQHGYRLEDKQLRNEVVIVASILAQRKPCAKKFMETGFVDLLVEAVAPPEGSAITPEQKRYYLSPHPYDVEFKQLVLFLLCQLCQSEDQVAQLVKRSPFVPALITLLDPKCKKHPLYSAYKQTYLVSVQLDALRVLAKLALVMPLVFDTECFCRVLALMQELDVERQRLEALTHLTTELEHNVHLSLEALRFFHNTKHLDCFKSALESIPEFSSVLTRLSTLGEAGGEVGLEAGHSKVIPTVNGSINVSAANMAMNPVEKSFHPHASVETRIYDNEKPKSSAMKLGCAVTVRETALSLLAGLAPTLGFSDVSFVLSRIELDSMNFAQTQAYLSFAVQLLAQVVIGDASREFQFVSRGGCERLLDLMEQGPSILAGQIIGSLTDLAKNPFAKNNLLAWRSHKSSQTAVQLILDVIAKELCGSKNGMNNNQSLEQTLREPFEKFLEAVYRNSKELAVETEEKTARKPQGYPAKLRGALERSKSISPKGEQQALNNVNDLCIAVYVLLDVLGFEKVQEEHKLSFKHLKILTILSGYKSLVLGHVWRQIKEDLEADGLNPIEPDQALLDEQLEKAVEECEEIYCQLDEVDVKEYKEMQEQDRQFYRKILKRKGQELEAKQLIDRVRKRQSEKLRASTIVPMLVE